MSTPINAAPSRTNRASHIVIAGQGRSGTNWLLRIFDQSPATHCRNEVNAFEASPFWRLPSPTVWDEANRAGLEATWDEAVRWAHARMGERDPRTTSPKQHYNEVWRELGLLSLVQRERSRRLLGTLLPSLRQQEWLPPRILADRAKLAGATPVLKFSQLPGWLPWILHSRPEAHVIHIVRHPGGFLASWMSRFLAQHDRAETTEANRARLREVVRADARWAARFGDIDPMSAEEAELWYWAYCTETIHKSGADAARYELVIYEEVLADPVGVMRPIFGRAGVEWNGEIEQRVLETATMPAGSGRSWREKLDAGRLEIVERVLASTPYAGWWEDAAEKPESASLAPAFRGAQV